VGKRTRDFAFVSLCYGRSGEEICTGYAMAASGRMQYDYKQTKTAAPRGKVRRRAHDRGNLLAVVKKRCWRWSRTCEICNRRVIQILGMYGSTLRHQHTWPTFYHRRSPPPRCRSSSAPSESHEHLLAFTNPYTGRNSVPGTVRPVDAAAWITWIRIAAARE